VLDPDDTPLERSTFGRAGELPSCPDPLSSKASVEGEEERGEVGEEAVLLAPAPTPTSGVAPPGVLCVESISVLGFLKRFKREYLEPRRRE
jgi:hypothetical protein